MNLAELTTFLAIVETGSLVRASERLNVAQSTVTARLKNLEDALNQVLLHRHTTPLELTAAGINFKRYAEAMVDLWRQARMEASLSDSVDVVCNLGCEWDLWAEFGQRLICDVHRDHDATALSARPGEYADLARWLDAGLIDLALTARPDTHEGRDCRHIATQNLVLYTTRPGSPLVFDPHYVYVDAGEEFARSHTAFYSRGGIAKVAFTSTVWALDFLLERGGTAYLPEKLAAPHLASGKLHLMPDAPAFSRNVYLTTNKSAHGSWSWLDPQIEALSC